MRIKARASTSFCCSNDPFRSGVSVRPENAGRTHRSRLGLFSIRSPGHIGLLFISSEFQGRGVGRALCEAALAAFASAHTLPPKLTVKSSPGAVAFYEKVGFLVTGQVTEFNGIRFVPMERDLGV